MSCVVRSYVTLGKLQDLLARISACFLLPLPLLLLTAIIIIRLLLYTYKFFTTTEHYRSSKSAKAGNISTS